MEKIIMLPTWILLNLIRPFLSNKHILKKYITLDEWITNTTSLTFWLSMLMWNTLINLIIILIIIHFK